MIERSKTYRDLETARTHYLMNVVSLDKASGRKSAGLLLSVALAGTLTGLLVNDLAGSHPKPVEAGIEAGVLMLDLGMGATKGLDYATNQRRRETNMTAAAIAGFKLIELAGAPEVSAEAPLR